KLHYLPRQQWDFVADADDQSIDLSMIIPHYRAHNQPNDYRLSMHIHSRQGEIKTTVCRKSPRSPFFLFVHSSSTAPVTLYLPSDFCGVIRLPSRKQNVSLSPSFSARVLPRVHWRSAGGAGSMRKSSLFEDEDEHGRADEVEVCAAGPLTLRVWDVVEGAPERPARESWRKMVKRATSRGNIRQQAQQQQQQQQQQAIDWDFLLDD
ncbi:hypothetical protein FA95DRAFT_1495930, partial [Auriscalpium vulgare]